jgi:multidrug transporter EmrE-like cation transporter
MTVMNLLFDVISDITVTTVGLLYFKESVSNMKKVGLVFAFVGIILMSWDSINGNK